MQPTYDESPNSDTGSWGPKPGPGYAPPPPVDTLTKARPWLIALWSFVTLLVIIAAAGNQWVVDAVQRHSNGNTFGDHMARLVLAYQWRFSPQGGHDFAHTWVAELADVGAVLVLTLLLVAVVARGFGRFWQTFFSVWFVVVASTLVGGYVRSSVIDQSQYPGYTGTKVNDIFFSAVAPATTTIIAGFIVGLIVAFLAAIVAVATRRSNVVSAPPPTSSGVPWSRSDEDDDEDRRWQTAPAPGPTPSPSPWSSAPAGPGGEAGPGGAAGPEHTTQLPSVEQPRPAGEGEATTELPRHSSPPPDER